MARVLACLAVVAMAGAWFPDLAAAQSVDAPRVTTNRGQGAITWTLHSHRLRASQTLSASRFVLTMTEGGDAVEISGDVAGQVTVRRAGRTLALSLKDATVAEAGAVRALLRGSAAISRLGTVTASAWGRSSREGLVFASAHAMAALLQGHAAPLKAVAQRLEAASRPGIRTVQMTAGQCWLAYTRDVLSYTYELEQCIEESSNSLNPLRSAWCAYSYNLKASLAFVWLLDCSGY